MKKAYIKKKKKPTKYLQYLWNRKQIPIQKQIMEKKKYFLLVWLSDLDCGSKQIQI